MSERLTGLPSLQPHALAGTAFRAVNLRHVETPLSAVGSVLTGGRYNAKGTFEALYLAENPTTTLLEVQFAASSGGRFVAQPHDPYVVFSVAFRLQRLVDLHDPRNLAQLGLSPTDLQRPWRLKQARGEPVLTQKIGRALFDLGHEGLNYPSATDGTANLAVFPDNLRPGSALEITWEGRTLARLP